MEQLQVEESSNIDTTNDFNAKGVGEVVKVRKCTFANDDVESKNFYICPCKGDKFYPICEACALNCHATHRPAQLINENFICLCGKDGHDHIEGPSNEIFGCIYTKFHEITEHGGFYKVGSKTLCSVCMHKCNGAAAQPDSELLKGFEHTCECTSHAEVNVINMNADLADLTILDHFQNYNFNILDKTPKTKELILDVLRSKFEFYHNLTLDANKEEFRLKFFTDMIILKIFEIFSNLKNMHNPFIVLNKDMFKLEYEKDLINLLSFDEKALSIIANSRDACTYSYSKIYYAEFMFNYLIRRKISNKLVRVNGPTYSNLNILQRCLYFHNPYEFSKNTHKGVALEESRINLFIKNLLNLYENILKLDEIFSIDHLKQIVFLKFNKIFKDLIKFNLIEDEERKKYFELVRDSVVTSSADWVDSKLDINDRSINKESPYYIMKSLFFSLVYLNDKYVLDKYKKDENELNQDKDDLVFAFNSNKDSNLYSYIFSNIICSLDKQVEQKNPFALKKMIKYDFYVKKIFELMICTNEHNFYMKSLENLKYYPNSQIKKLFLSTGINDRFFSQLKMSMNQEQKQAYEAVNNFSVEITSVCNSFQDYSIKFPKFIKISNEIFDKLYNFLHDNLEPVLPKFVPYWPYIIQDNGRNIDTILYDKKIKYIQEAVQLSTFYSAINKFFFIYGWDKKFRLDFPENKVTNDIIKKENLEMILAFLYLSMKDNYSNLSLINTFHPSRFVIAFSEIETQFYIFLSYINEILFSDTNNSYKIDNYTFYYRVIQSICHRLKFDEVDHDIISNNILIMGTLLSLTKKAVRFATFFNNEIIELIDSINLTIIKLKAKILNYFMDYFKEDIFNSWPENLQKNLTFCIKHYFSFIRECHHTGILYMDNIDDDDNFIYKKEDMELILNNGYFNDLFVKQRMLDNYVGMFFNFNFKNSKSDTDNMIRMLYATYGNNGDKIFNFKDRNVSPIHLTDFETALNYKSNENILDEKTKYFKHLEELNEIKMPFMKKLLDDFPKFIEDCSKVLTKPYQHRKKIFKIYRYYTYLIMNPLFTIFNHYLLLESEIRGQESYKIYDLVFSFLQVTIRMYEDPLIQSIEKSHGFRELMDREGLHIVDKLHKSKLNSLTEDLHSLTNDIKYFEVEKIIEIYRKNLGFILTKNFIGKNYDMAKTQTLNFHVHRESTKLDGEEEELKTHKDSQEHLISDDEKIIEAVATLYKNSFSNVPSKSLSFVEIIANNSNEYGDLNLELEIYNYLEQKLCDHLTYNNVNTLTEYKYNDFDDIFTSEGKGSIGLQNFYVINILNYLCFHDVKSFQTQIVTRVEDNTETYNYLLKYLITNSIFANLVYEVKMMYQLDLFAYKNKSTLHIENNLSYEMALNSIEFIFHLIENQNQCVQNILYDMDITDATESIKIENDPNFKNASEKSYKEKVIEKTLREQYAESSEEDKNLARKTMMESSSIPAKEQENINVKTLKELELPTEFEKLGRHKFNCLSFILLQMKIVIKNIPLNEKSLIFYNREFRSYNKLLNIYNSFSNLLIQMIQGTNAKNFKLFYRKIPGLIIEEYYSENSEYFYFLKYAKEIKELIMSENIVDLSTLPIKTSIFNLLNSLISQDLVDDDSLVAFCSNIFDLKDLLYICSRYLKAAYIKHVFDIDYTSDKFVDLYETFEFDEESYQQLTKTFNDDILFSIDDFFKLASQIFLFISILSEKFNVASAKNILNSFASESFELIEKKHEDVKKIGKNKVGDFNLKAKKNIPEVPQEVNPSLKKMNSIVKTVTMDTVLYKLMHRVRNIKVKEKTTNNCKATKLFFMKIIKTCEFVIDSANDETDEEKVKTVFFIVDPRTLLIAQDSYDNFFDNVDRSGSNSKLKGLIDTLPIFESEIGYKLKVLKESGDLKWFNIDYQKVEFMSFLISVIIVIYLFVRLTAANVNDFYMYYPIFALAATQMSINLYYLYIFYKNKLDYYVMLNKLQLTKKKLTWSENVKLRVIDSFLLNEETCIMWVNVLIAALSFHSRQWTFLFTVQLLGVVRFVETIKQIFFAFRMRFAQFISMIGFLAILINLYAMFGFFFEVNQFKIEVETDEGTVEKNMCDTLISCYILYFNHGVKSGGGIGDLLAYRFMEDDPYYYWIRYLADFVFYFTIIVLLLNMINGIIISTFATLRKDNEEKNEDIKNKCFMCSIPKVEFDKRKIDFKEHINKTHNYITYIMYLVALKLKDESTIDSDQQYILKSIMERRIKFFPIGTSVCFNTNGKIESLLDE
jgi:hypothetical protein